ncbi:MAG: hypothetical protein PHG40_01280 [Candidatus Omnitrophica bacterium]|nr:hypothetical protein [Candidatus Omnitrophota bacterium]
MIYKRIFAGIILSVLPICLCACASNLNMAKENKKLTFLGKVTRIENSPLENSNLDWIITVNVNKVLSGSFSGRIFQFRVHSPSKSGLEIGWLYRIEAVQTQDGYVVNRYPRPERLLPENPTQEQLKEIGQALLSALETKLKTDDIFGSVPDKVNILKRSFAPFTEDYYIADWYLDEEVNTLYCPWWGSQDVRCRLVIHLEYRDGKWQDTNGVQMEQAWRAR